MIRNELIIVLCFYIMPRAKMNLTFSVKTLIINGTVSLAYTIFVSIITNKTNSP